MHDWNRNLPFAAALMLRTVVRQPFTWKGQRVGAVQ